MNPLAGDELTARTRLPVRCELWAWFGVVWSTFEHCRGVAGALHGFVRARTRRRDRCIGEAAEQISVRGLGNSLQVVHHWIVTARQGRFGIQQCGERVRSILFMVEPAAQPVTGLGPQCSAAMERQDDHIRRGGFDGGLLRQQWFAQQIEPPQPGAQGRRATELTGQQVERLMKEVK